MFYSQKHFLSQMSFSTIGVEKETLYKNQFVTSLKNSDNWRCERCFYQ